MNNFTVQRLCAWSGAVGVTVFFLGILLSGYIPPASPALTQEQVAAYYQSHATGIRGGMVLMLISGMFITPMVGVISAQMKRSAGIHPALIYAQVSAGTTGAVFFFVAPLFFLAAAYRPERPAELTYLMNDLAWIALVIPWPPAFMQLVIIGVGVLGDRSAKPVFPRWVGYLNFWVALGFVPGGLLPFFKHGPLCWSGILVFWLAATVFGLWFAAMTTALLQAIRAEESAVPVAG